MTTDAEKLEIKSIQLDLAQIYARMLEMQAQYQTLLTNQQQSQQKYQAAMSRIMKAHKLEGDAGVGWSPDDNGNLVKRVVDTPKDPKDVPKKN